MAIGIVMHYVDWLLTGARLKTTVINKTGKCKYKSDIEVISINLCYSGKAKSVNNSECVSVALSIQRAMRIRRIIISFVA
jgi:hypothetical protein